MDDGRDRVVAEKQVRHLDGLIRAWPAGVLVAAAMGVSSWVGGDSLRSSLGVAFFVLVVLSGLYLGLRYRCAQMRTALASEDPAQVRAAAIGARWDRATMVGLVLIFVLAIGVKALFV